MRIIEEIIQRLVAFALTAVWFVIPLGVGLFQPSAPRELVEVDDSRLVERVVVFESDVYEPVREGLDGVVPEAPPAPEATEPEPTPADAAPAGDDGTGDGTPMDAAPQSETPIAARRGSADARRVHVLPGVERGEREAPVRERPKEKPCADPVDTIEKVGPASWTVDRSMVEEYAADLEKVYSLGWVRRHEDERGRNDGFEVRGIRCGTPLHQAGLKNRDVVHTVNGKKVNNIFQAWAAYRSAKRREAVELEVTRDGETLFLRYDVID